MLGGVAGERSMKAVLYADLWEAKTEKTRAVNCQV
jgi:hypothetical protein